MLIDTNLLLLAVIGNFDPRLIGRKRLSSFSLEDFEVLNPLVSSAKRVITTPGILTETSNLAAQMIGERRLSEFYLKLRAVIKKLDERYEKSAIVSEEQVFLRFGLTDAAISHICGKGMLVLTDDWPLSGYLAKNGIDVVNFNHLRALP